MEDCVVIGLSKAKAKPKWVPVGDYGSNCGHYKADKVSE